MIKWTSIDTINELEPGWTQLHCDTRDFHLLSQTVPVEKAFGAKLDKIKTHEEYLIDEDRILPFLKEIKAFSGGNVEWRFLSFKGISTPAVGSWATKYIRFYRTDRGIVVAGTSCDVVYGLPWREFTKDRLDVESLNAHDI